MVAQLFYAEFHSDTPPLIASYCMALLRTGPDDLVYGVMPFLHVEHEDLSWFSGNRSIVSCELMG